MSPTLIVLRKEITEALRDRSLLVNLVLVPLFFYPLLGFGAYQVFQVIQGASEGKQLTVWLDGDVPEDLVERLEGQENLTLETVPPSLDAGDLPASSAAYREMRQMRRDANEEVPEALLSWWRGRTEWRDETGGVSVEFSDSVRVLYDSSREDSGRARGVLVGIVSSYRDSLVEVAATSVGLSERDLTLWELVEEDTSSARQWGRYLLSMMLPIFVVIMLPQGAYYATLDTVVGERERGTLETLLTSPLDRRDILRGKFLFVLGSSLFTFTLNLLSLLLFATFALSLMDLGDQFRIDLHPAGILLIVVAAALTACFLAAAMMIVAVPSKNYREGQAALMPLYLFPAMAGLMVSMSSESFTMTTALIPIVNVVALMKSVIRGEVPTGPAVVTLLVLALLAWLGIRIAARLSEREEIYFDPELSLKRLFRLERSRS